MRIGRKKQDGGVLFVLDRWTETVTSTGGSCSRSTTSPPSSASSSDAKNTSGVWTRRKRGNRRSSWSRSGTTTNFLRTTFSVRLNSSSLLHSCGHETELLLTIRSFIHSFHHHHHVYSSKTQNTKAVIENCGHDKLGNNTYNCPKNRHKSIKTIKHKKHLFCIRHRYSP